MRTCQITGKVKYKDRIAALLSLASLQWEDNPDHTEQRMNKCRWCKGWHLTSQAEDEYEKKVVRG